MINIKYEIEFIRNEKEPRYNHILVFGETDIKGIAEKCFEEGCSGNVKSIKFKRVKNKQDQ